MKYIKEFKGNFKVEYHKPDGTHNTYYYDDSTKAKVKYIELVIRQVSETMELSDVSMSILYDYGGEDKLGFVKVLESKMTG